MGLILNFSVFAEGLSSLQIAVFAKDFLSQKALSNQSVKSIEKVKYNGLTTSYAVHLSPKGFVLISADDKVEPIIAYSLESDYIDSQQWPDHLRWWMNNTNQKITRRINDNTAGKHKGWEQEAYSLKSASSIKVDPLIKVKWDQGRNWNTFCPEDEEGPGGYAYVGCVAVSMAQAMSCYEYPTQGQGKASYVHELYGSQKVNFDEEIPYAWDSMPLTSANEHNARFLYHCAVTVNMDFGADGSGALTKTASGALKNYFNYSETTKSIDRVEDDDEWKAILIENLQNGYPIIYHGDGDDGQSGHAWNIDGIDESGIFHLNWGWSGSMNGYFNINNLAPGSYDFTKNQGAILGIKPKFPGPIDIILPNQSVKENLPPGSFVSLVKIEDEFPDNSYSYKLKGNFSVFTEDYAPANFFVENDSLKTLKTFDYSKRQFYTLFIEAVDSLGNSMEKEFEILIDQAIGIESIATIDGLKVYPNPIVNQLTIESISESSAKLYNLQGQLILSIPKIEGKRIIDISDLNKGSYILRIRNDEGAFYNKLIKE